MESDGGRGMGAEEIQVWLNWGEGEEHEDSHIGRYHQGGKAACGFLGRHVRLWAKRAESDDIWFLEDENWDSRREAKSFGIPTPLTSNEYPASMRDLPFERGHVRLEVSKLNRDRRWNLQVLKRELSNTYRRLLKDGQVSIRINGERVAPLEIPLSTSGQKVRVEVKLTGGRSASGWAGRLQREKLPVHLKSGLRLVHNGRLVKEGEWFGYNYEGKGALNSLVGELHLKRFTPTPNKTDFVERSDEVWEKLGKEVLHQLEPLIRELRKSGAEERVSRDEKERAREVADELEKVFASPKENPELDDSVEGTGSSTGPNARGRKRPQPQPPRPEVQNPRGPNVNPPQPRTPPPDDPVGSLKRLLYKATGSSRPPIRIRSWDSSERSAWTTEGTRVWLDINKSYHLYKSLKGVKPYLAETAILELCKSREGESMSAEQYLELVNSMLLKWDRVVSPPEEE